MPFFFAQRDGSRAVIRGDDAAHLARSLRARPGEEIEVVDPAGFLLTVRLTSVSTARVEGDVVAEVEHRPEPSRRVAVAVAHLPAATLDLILSRCTEVGAHEFVVFRADRSVTRPEKMARWKTIVREAAMLAGRLHVPDVALAGSLDDVAASFAGVVLLDRAARTPLAAVAQGGELTLALGPEGGWTDRELAVVARHATLGPRNLRADTAAIVATAIAVGA